MLKKVLKTVAMAAGIGISVAASPFSPAQASPEAQGFSLWTSGERSGIAFDLWTRPAREGGGFYYLLWEGTHANVTDRSQPEVAVFFDSNIATVNGDWLVDCYNNGSYGSECLDPSRKPNHVRQRGSIPAPLR